MRLCLFCLLLCASLGGQPAPDSATDAASRTAHIEGQVLTQAGEPLRKVTVRLTLNENRRSNPVYYTDTTDGAGKFVFEDVIPGRYMLSAERTGYLLQNYGARGPTNSTPGLVLTLAAGQSMKDLDFKLIPQGVITGRVIDADGDPMPGVDVWVSSMNRFRGKSQLSLRGAGRTDDQGGFRIANLSPGTYYVSANDTQPRVRPQEIAGRPGRVLNRASSVITYYPASLDAAGAIGLQILAGSELRGIDIRMRQEPVFSIRGVTIDAATGKAATANLIARLKGDSQNGFGLPWETSSREDGTFELRNLLRGEYVLAASTNNPSDPATGREEVSLSDSDVTGVKLTLSKGTTVTGSVKLEGDGPPIHPMIALSDLEGMLGRSSNAQIEDDGTFALHGVMTAKYAVLVDALPEGVYVKSIRFGQQDVTRTKLDLTSGVSGTLDILLSPGAAEVSGTVRNKDGVAMSGVEITLWPRGMPPESVWNGLSSSSTDQNGDFHITGLVPGAYYAVAWEEVESGLIYDIAFLKRFESQTTAVTLEEGSRQTVQPKLISREDVAAEAAKLP